MKTNAPNEIGRDNAGWRSCFTREVAGHTELLASVAHLRRWAKVSMRSIQLVLLLLVVSLCGCSRGNLGDGTPYLDGDGFFVCQKCGGLSATIEGSGKAACKDFRPCCDLSTARLAGDFTRRLHPQGLDLASRDTTAAARVESDNFDISR